MRKEETDYERDNQDGDRSKKEREKKGKGEGPEGRREEIWRLKQKRGTGTTRSRHKSQRLLEGGGLQGVWYPRYLTTTLGNWMLVFLGGWISPLEGA